MLDVSLDVGAWLARGVFGHFRGGDFRRFHAGVMQSEIVLRHLVALASRFDKPIHGFSVALLHAPSGLVAKA